ncbi:hypothetical protein MNBD_GAMMA11-2239 [hydrothermal vent metagenome]|uniref:DUF3047 domain-containing protein n=1 Tax=hydrothermal vent metagenome TaxID=652676 RepID=A0A3B0XBM6_9ZZZZ
MISIGLIYARLINIRYAVILVVLVIVSRDAHADSTQIMRLAFAGENNQQLQSQWQAYGFGDIAHTDYSLVADSGGVVLKARSEDSASGLIHHIRFNPYEYPYISWRWKMLKAPAKSDARAKSTDDYALRLYINFDFDIDKLPFDEQFAARLYQKLKGEKAPLASLNYIWENNLSKETVIASPYTERVQMLVLQNRYSEEGVWNFEQRNIVDDYVKAFGEPPADVISIAVMTDSDNTQGSSLAYYGDIVLSKTAR